jgi:hypothetical protein
MQMSQLVSGKKILHPLISTADDGIVVRKVEKANAP